MNINGIEFLIGADPECFVTEGSKLISGHGLIPGDKKSPHKVDNGAVQVDGMALEFNIDPVEDHQQFTRNIDRVLGQLKQMIPGKELVFKPSVVFDEEVFKNSPKVSKILGCEPDYNAYTGQPNPRPKPPIKTQRTGSGHIHIGWTRDVDPFDKGHFEACCTLVKFLDVFLGIPALLWDQDSDRRKMYGDLGAFRPKSYGLEYRVLSNAWVVDKSLHKYIFNKISQAIQSAFAQKEFPARGTLYNLQCLAKNLYSAPAVDDETYYKIYNNFNLDTIPHKYLDLCAEGSLRFAKAVQRERAKKRA